jgi:hypothetical protein
MLNAERILATFQTCAVALAASLDSIKGRLPDETLEQLSSVKTQLQRASFKMTSDNSRTLADFKNGTPLMPLTVQVLATLTMQPLMAL